MKVKDICNSKKAGVAIAVAGGGCRTALLGMKVMKFMNFIKNAHVVAGCSGGAWGIAMYYLYRYDTRKFVDILIENTTKIRTRKANMYILTISKMLEAGPLMNTAAYMIPIIKHYHFDWECIIKLLIFGEHNPTWNIFPSNVVVLFPTTLLCNSRN